ncbi:hypothetical protein Cme02nite_43630 [Catellatospora methionotrophica]|uniref:Uncharacterized protein n=1 Tax=Catellatospora methionotrophica TaxID=121620 RepID=A0A8J3PI48_9ACTN|nr:hypothetical protein Cme02nite_43630 [Catellatospora methionotrophica]
MPGHATRETDITAYISVALAVRAIPLPRKEDRTDEPVRHLWSDRTTPAGVARRGEVRLSGQKVSRGA